MIYRMYSDPSHGEVCGAVPDARRLLRHALESETGIADPESETVRDGLGKPALRNHPEIHFSISHCRGLASCVIADRPAGIDSERVRPYSAHAARHCCSGTELEAIGGAPDPDRIFFALWTLKESCVKAMGAGLSYPLRQVEFRLTGRGIECPGYPEYRFVLLEDARGFMTAVCYRLPGGVEWIIEDTPNAGDGYGRIYTVS